MKSRTFKTLLSLLFVCVTLAFVSCGDDDDKVDCGKAVDSIEDAFDNYYAAYFEGDCDDLDDLFDKAVKAIKKGKSCSEVKDEVEDAGYDSVQDFIDDFEDEHEDNKDDCSEPT